jgi:hypothetical protein
VLVSYALRDYSGTFGPFMQVGPSLISVDFLVENSTHVLVTFIIVGLMTYVWLLRRSSMSCVGNDDHERYQ